MSSPGVKGDAVQEGTIVVVPDVITNHGFACARLRHHLVLDGDVILRVMNVHQQDIKHQGRLRGNLFTWRAEGGECFELKHLPTFLYLERGIQTKDYSVHD